MACGTHTHMHGEVWLDRCMMWGHVGAVQECIAPVVVLRCSWRVDAMLIISWGSRGTTCVGVVQLPCIYLAPRYLSRACSRALSHQWRVGCGIEGEWPWTVKDTLQGCRLTTCSVVPAWPQDSGSSSGVDMLSEYRARKRALCCVTQNCLETPTATAQFPRGAFQALRSLQALSEPLACTQLVQENKLPAQRVLLLEEASPCTLWVLETTWRQQ